MTEAVSGIRACSPGGADRMDVGEAAYRPDLDGLRAIAVAVVLFYHAEWAGFSGGYVGVDVFFVLSGYLISRLIERDVRADRFRFKSFYLRRFRRLFPALFATVAISFGVGAAMLSAPQLAALASEAIAALLSVSNFFFWQQSGYFDAQAITKPLLHTWSLGIEEQFYLLWPALWVGCLRFRSGRFTFPLLGLLSLGSWGIAEYALGESPAASFFLLPARLFEFWIGAMLVRLDRMPPVAQGIREGSSAAGLGLIAYSVMSFDEWTRFPGTHALVPVLGAALVIAFGSGPRLSALLCHPLCVGLGRISYSLYLVHWPVFVFYRGWTLEAFSYPERIGLLVVSAGLATGLHRWVERPFRMGAAADRAAETPRLTPFGLAGALAAAALVAALLSASASGGWTWRYPASAQEMGDLELADEERMTWTLLREIEGRPFRETANRGDARVLVIGDSQAGDFANLLVASGVFSAEALSSIVVMAECGTVYVPDAERADYFKRNRRVQSVRNTAEQIVNCEAQWERLFSDERLGEASHIFVANLWYDYHLPFLERTAEALRSRSAAQVVFVGNKSLSTEPLDFLAACFRPAWLIGPQCGSKEELHASAARLVDPAETRRAAAMKAAAMRGGAGFVDLYPLVCPEETGCRLLSEAGRPIYLDRFHTTRAGIADLGRRFALRPARTGQRAAARARFPIGTGSGWSGSVSGFRSHPN